MTSLPELQAVEIKAMVPAKDLDQSLRFYKAIGFVLAWSSGDLAYLHHGTCSFLLQRFFVAAHASNFQMHLLVDSADRWYSEIQSNGVAAEFGISISAPEDRPWGLRDFTLNDPAGVLWRIGHNLSAP